MLIGLSGKIGSGKDTVGKIIQVLCFLEKIKIPYCYEAFEHNLKHNFAGNNYYGDWHIKKFAAKLKQIVALLTGCKAEDLESQEFKNQELNTDWDFSYVYNFENELVKVPVGKGYEDGKLPVPFDKMRNTYTYRKLLQLIGTEAMRDIIHENVWVNALFADYDNAIKKVPVPFKEGETMQTYINPDWIITDMRFPNEMKAITDRKGITMRINRYNNVHITKDVNVPHGYIAGVDPYEHPSETALDNAEFDYNIENDGTIQDLVEKVRVILLDAKILKVA